MNRMQWEAAIHRLRQMEERLPEGSFDRLSLEQARKAAQSKIPTKVRYGGGAWRCPACAMAARPGDRYCGYCGQRYEQSEMIRTNRSPNGWVCFDCHNAEHPEYDIE